jgi:hypothetical protein
MFFMGRGAAMPFAGAALKSTEALNQSFSFLVTVLVID